MRNLQCRNLKFTNNEKYRFQYLLVIYVSDIERETWLERNIRLFPSGLATGVELH